MNKKDDNISHILSLPEKTPDRGNLYLGGLSFLNDSL